LRSRDERYADILARLIETAQEEPLRYHNAGLGASVISPRSPGYDSSVRPSAVERLDKEVIDREPDLLVIAYGLNDMRAGMTFEEFLKEMEDILRRIRERVNPLIVLVNVYHLSDYSCYPPFDRGSLEVTKEYNEGLARLAEDYGCAYADVWSAEGERDYVMHVDTVHANKIGNLLIAHKIFEAVVHAAPGIADNVNKRDAETSWAKRSAEMKARQVEPSGNSKPGE